MFFIGIFLIYPLVSIYSYLRILKLISGKRNRWFFTIIYLMLVLIFPLTEHLAHYAGGTIVKYFLLFGYSTLPIFLYLFLITLCFDVLLVTNLVIKIIKPNIINGNTFRLSRLIIMLTLPIVITIIGTIKYNQIIVNKYKIEVTKKNSQIKHLKIGLVADIHLNDLTDIQFVKNFIEKTNSLNLDILLIPGDVVEGDRQDVEMVEFERLLKKISTKYGIYASLGNHESHGTESKLDVFDNSNIKVIQDSYQMIDSSFYLVGKTDGGHNSTGKPLQEVLKSVPNDLPVILLHHKPVDLDIVSKSNVDIQVSGHTHNGQMFPINFITSSIYKISWGYEKICNTHFFVTSGIQGWGAHVRTVGDSEIMVIDVDFK